MSSSSTLPALRSNSILPSIVCLKSVYNDKFLRYVAEDIQTHGLLHFSGDKVMDPAAQFDVIPSVAGDGLVHLKCRRNNKFLVRWSPIHCWITASGNKLNEDRTNWACTLFEPSSVASDPMKIRLFHVQLGHYANLSSTDKAPFGSCLFAGSNATRNDSCDVFIVVNGSHETSLHNKIPKNVAFKGDNGKYLGPFLSNGTHYLQFTYNKSTDPKVAHEVTTSSDGTVTIKSKYYGQFWRLGADNYIVADIDKPVISDASSLFRVNVLGVNAVALMNMKKTWYCNRYTQSDVKDSLLNSNFPSVNQWSVLQITNLGP